MVSKCDAALIIHRVFALIGPDIINHTVVKDQTVIYKNVSITVKESN